MSDPEAVYSIPLRTSYTLNTNYHLVEWTNKYDKQAQIRVSCRTGSLYPVVGALVVVVVVVLLGGSVKGILGSGYV